MRALAATVLLVGVAVVGACERVPPEVVERVDPCAVPANDIVAENCRPGNPSPEWDVNGSGDPTIQGFGHNISVNRGAPIEFKIRTDSTDYRIDIYRMGYYGGMGARRVDTVEPSVTLPQEQPECFRDDTTHIVDCGNWGVSASWRVPAGAVSGIYFARLVREDPEPSTWRADNSHTDELERPPPSPHAYGASGLGRLANALVEPRASHIYFVVRDDEGGSDVLFQTSDTTWQAYNRWGDTSTYGTFDPTDPRPRAYKVSYNRPFATRAYRAVNLVFQAEYPMVRWLEANGYDVSYTTGVDSDRRGAEILEHALFLSVGHDEYWSGSQRANVEAARAAGVNLAFFSGNEVFWKTRWENSFDGTGTPYRTLVTYKETHDTTKIDPLPDVWTGTWRDSRPFNPEGPQPENALTGTIFTVNAWRNDPLVVPAAYGRLRFWRNTEIAGLQAGQTAVLLKGILGHEWDEDIDNGFRPAGLIRMSETTIDNVLYIQDHGTVYDSGTATHHLTLYRHESGALVFGAGTVQWSWGLDAHHDTESGMPPERANPYSIRVGVDPNGPDRNIQQATVNLFADMGVQPVTLQADLVAAIASTDLTAPVSEITSPADGSTHGGAALMIRGTASDPGGGVVGGVEVSVDGGSRWHPARHDPPGGSVEWSYEVAVTAAGTFTILSRAVDDSGNIESPGKPVTVHLKGV